jgi:hypothetical protein
MRGSRYLSPDLQPKDRALFKAAGMLIYTITEDGTLMASRLSVSALCLKCPQSLGEFRLTT